MNGDPLSFQLWTNQQMRFHDIKYQIMVWNYQNEKSDLCTYKGDCPTIYVPASSKKKAVPNALLVNKLALQYIQPVVNEDITCTVMMLENLAKPNGFQCLVFTKS